MTVYISKNKLHVYQRDSASNVISVLREIVSHTQASGFVKRVNHHVENDRKTVVSEYRPCRKAIWEYFFGSTIYSASQHFHLRHRLCSDERLIDIMLRIFATDSLLLIHVGMFVPVILFCKSIFETVIHLFLEQGFLGVNYDC